jgi:ribosomal protein L37AE/L43A
MKAPSTQEKLRIQQGLQCPECSGVRIDSRRSIGESGWLCTECGCQWTPSLYLGDAR